MDEQEKGEIIAVFDATITLRDPNPDDVSRANRPIVPDEPTIKTIEAAIETAVGELGYAVNARLSRTDR